MWEEKVWSWSFCWFRRKLKVREHIGWIKTVYRYSFTNWACIYMTRTRLKASRQWLNIKTYTYNIQVLWPPGVCLNLSFLFHILSSYQGLVQDFMLYRGRKVGTRAWSLDFFENNDAKLCIPKLFETIFIKLELLRNVERKDAFWCHLKRCFRIWNCWEHFKNKDARCCILTLFETMFWKLKLLRTFWKQGH